MHPTTSKPTSESGLYRVWVASPMACPIGVLKMRSQHEEAMDVLPHRFSQGGLDEGLTTAQPRSGERKG